VFRAIRPFRDAGIELDVVQLTPIAIYNSVVHGVLEDVPNASEYDPDEPPPSVAVISMGTDTTDLVVTNGFRIWQRSIPIGGSHFTKQLTKEMKLTFAKAEHLKRNARQAEDPKAVFQAMRPVFNDFVQELQRSLGYFRSIERRAVIKSAIALGNAMLLPGLEPYIEKNLDLPVKRIHEFRRLEGASVTSTPKFKDNILSFPVCYGLCIQGLGKSRLSTNLIPREMVTSRLIRRKKPWALLALTVFLLGISFNYLFNWSRWRAAHEDRFAEVAQQVQSVSQTSSNYISRDNELQGQFDQLKKLGNEVVGGADARFLVLELFRAINSALPPVAGNPAPGTVSKVPYKVRTELYIESIDSEYFSDLSTYFTVDGAERYQRFLKDLAFAQARERSGDTSTPPPSEAEAEDDSESADAVAEDTADAEVTEESGADAIEVEMPDSSLFNRPGWVIQVKGFHFFEDEKDMFNRDAQYLTKTFLNQLENGKVELPAGPNQPPMEFTMKELGIYCPLIAADRREVTMRVPDLDYDPSKGPPPTSPRGEGAWGRRRDEPSVPMVNRTIYEFTVQFMWLETRASERLEARKQQQATADSAGELAGDL
jgi:type IV pilus assembly protein PilM